MTAGLVHSILRNPASPPLLSISRINAFHLWPTIKLSIRRRLNLQSDDSTTHN